MSKLKKFAVDLEAERSDDIIVKAKDAEEAESIFWNKVQRGEIDIAAYVTAHFEEASDE